MLAKFYPGAWYVPTHSDRAKIVNEFFDEHQHGLEESNFGGYQYELEYEVPEERGKGK